MEAHTVLQCCACENLVYYIFNLIYICTASRKAFFFISKETPTAERR